MRSGNNSNSAETFFRRQTTSRQSRSAGECAASPRFSDAPQIRLPHVSGYNILGRRFSLRNSKPFCRSSNPGCVVPNSGARRTSIENTKTREGTHWFLFPFGGAWRTKALVRSSAYRLSRKFPVTVTISVNDYGLELLPAQVLDVTEEQWREVLNPEGSSTIYSPA